ncbi:hypothetical protein G4G27_01825 [Sphingomonas sp. So64.6b]|uniref:hypothetical protein n=1 Tax=Sphingomonas sp. So64.6b TaxID=2997354 RepID=UPI001603F2EA|nr:hypothetical protein [Sphingomonas sp. So64.6b]QNA82889.1 hypothetical protein G4G27_01825 [Sphingomonas sp. So64.6b]
MKIHLAAIGMLMCLAGCSKAEEATGEAQHQGRYVGIGIYSPSKLWSLLKPAGSPKDKTAATLDDDSHVIVLVDSKTGEVRQCGNLSGYCVRMDPWSGSLPAAPASLTKHAADLAAAEAAEETTTVANAAEPMSNAR